MQNAETVLAIIRKRGEQRQPLERVYRQLFNRDLFLLAYGRIATNKGAMTPGVTEETIDGMSLAKIDYIINLLHKEQYQWLPVRRTYIPKKNRKLRPLGLPEWSDKLVQEVIRLLLNAYYEPQFSENSHGFRPERGCHTALQSIYHGWKGTTWFIEGDIAKYFDSLNHDKLLSILSENIRDGRLLNLINDLLKAGYLEDWKHHRTLSGTPQGGILSPLLANIYLDRFDQWVKTTLLPKYNRGNQRQGNTTYQKLTGQIGQLRAKGRYAEAKTLSKQRRTINSKAPIDPMYRRLRYVRYADDFLFGFIGPHSQAEEIKHEIGEFLRDNLKLDLSDDKTLITHAQTQTARFLGYELHVLRDDNKLDARGRRVINGVIGFRVPQDVVRAKCERYMFHGKPHQLTHLVNDSEYDIIARYQQEYRGVVEYYRMAYNIRNLDHLKWVMEGSLTRTLSAKLRITVSQIYDRFQTTQNTYKVLQVRVEREDKKPLVATWGGIALKRHLKAVLNDQPPFTWFTRTQLEQRLLANTCELCGATQDIEVHHIRALKDLNTRGRAPKPAWVEIMAARRRKTLVVCRTCHMDIHHGNPLRQQKAE